MPPMADLTQKSKTAARICLIASCVILLMAIAIKLLAGYEQASSEYFSGWTSVMGEVSRSEYKTVLAFRTDRQSENDARTCSFPKPVVTCTTCLPEVGSLSAVIQRKVLRNEWRAFWEKSGNPARLEDVFEQPRWACHHTVLTIAAVVFLKQGQQLTIALLERERREGLRAKWLEFGSTCFYLALPHQQRARHTRSDRSRRCRFNGRVRFPVQWSLSCSCGLCR